MKPVVVLVVGICVFVLNALRFIIAGRNLNEFFELNYACSARSPGCTEARTVELFENTNVVTLTSLPLFCIIVSVFSAGASVTSFAYFRARNPTTKAGAFIFSIIAVAADLLALGFAVKALVVGDSEPDPTSGFPYKRSIDGYGQFLIAVCIILTVLSCFQAVLVWTTEQPIAPAKSNATPLLVVGVFGAVLAVIRLAIAGHLTELSFNLFNKSSTDWSAAEKDFWAESNAVTGDLTTQSLIIGTVGFATSIVQIVYTRRSHTAFKHTAFALAVVTCVGDLVSLGLGFQQFDVDQPAAGSCAGFGLPGDKCYGEDAPGPLQNALAIFGILSFITQVVAVVFLAKDTPDDTKAAREASIALVTAATLMACILCVRMGLAAKDQHNKFIKRTAGTSGDDTYNQENNDASAQATSLALYLSIPMSAAFCCVMAFHKIAFSPASYLAALGMSSISITADVVSAGFGIKALEVGNLCLAYTTTFVGGESCDSPGPTQTWLIVFTLISLGAQILCLGLIVWNREEGMSTGGGGMTRLETVVDMAVANKAEDSA